MGAELLLIASLVLTQPPVTTAVGKAERPPQPTWIEMKADPILTVLTAPDKCRWLCIDEGAELAPAIDGKTAYFAASRPGRYRVLVVPSVDEPMRITVIVGSGPTPPVPPTPVPPTPVPPAPVDPLTAKLQAAFLLDTTDLPKKLVRLADLAALYTAAASFQSSATVGELVGRVRDAAKTLVLDGLMDCRKLIAIELAIAFPIDVPLDDASRAKAKALFLKLAACLKEVK